jgi:hypothetical protein
MVGRTILSGRWDQEGGCAETVSYRDEDSPGLKNVLRRTFCGRFWSTHRRPASEGGPYGWENCSELAVESGIGFAGKKLDGGRANAWGDHWR